MLQRSDKVEHDVNADIKKIKNILIAAFLIRLIMMVIVMFSGSWSGAFFGDITRGDDWRYLAGAENYLKSADSLIDREAFTSSYAVYGDWVGYESQNILVSPVLWYWIVCVVVYITKTKWAISFLNILLSVFSIIYVYKFTVSVYGKKTALLTVKLLAFLPYPVIFCIFGYKEQLAMLCTFYLLYKAVCIRYTNLIGAKNVIKIIFASIVLVGIRSGVSIILIGLCAVISFFNYSSVAKKNQLKIFFIALIVFVTVIIFILMTSDTIIYKFNAYLGSDQNVSDNSTLSFLLIRDVIDLWKLPLAYLFSIIVPIGLFQPIDSWSDVVGILDLVMAPVAVGATMYIIEKKRDKVVYWCCFAYYTIYLISSLNISRHYAALVPLSYIAFAEFQNESNISKKNICILLTLVLEALLIAYYSFKAVR